MLEEIFRKMALGSLHRHALRVLHEASFVFSDLRSLNVLIDADGPSIPG